MDSENGQGEAFQVAYAFSGALCTVVATSSDPFEFVKEFQGVDNNITG